VACPDCRAVAARLQGECLPSAPTVSLPTQDPLAVTQPSISGVPPELVRHPEYEVQRKLGEGGMGAVYLARNKLMDRLEVLKVINQDLLGRPGAAGRFLQEIRAAARLQHPNVVTAYTASRLGGLLVLAMEYVDGVDLAELVRKQGPLPVAHACHFARQVALALQHAHERGLVHRDIKPQNLILGRKNEVKVLDFGLAKVAREEGNDAGLTGANVMMGTPAYVAPEQAADARRADIRADLYSLGCTLYFLLTGRPPFLAERPMDVVLAHIQARPEPVDRLRPVVPVALAAVVARLLAKDPADRYQTPADVANALTAFIKSKIPPAPAVTQEKAAPIRVRKGLMWQAAATVGVLLSVVAVAWLLFSRTPPGETQQAASPGQVVAFVPLFNGKDLAGWRPLPVGPALWEVRDGVLVGRGGTGHLFYAAKQFENFHLRVEARINDGGNSGVYFRTPFGPASPQGYPLGGYEAQISNTHKDPRKTGSLLVPAGPGVSLASSPVGDEEWFTLEVVAEGPHLVVKINGLVTSDYVDAAPSALAGQVALQVHNAGTEVRFRRVEIKELPARDLHLRWAHSGGAYEHLKGDIWLEETSKAGWIYHRQTGRSAEMVVLRHTENLKLESHLRRDTVHFQPGNGRWALAYNGGWKVAERLPQPARSAAARVGEWVPLFDGRDLNGWKVSKASQGNAAAEGGDLVLRTNGNLRAGLLSRRADFTNFHLRTEVSLQGTGKPQPYCAGLAFRASPDEATSFIKCYGVRFLAYPDGTVSAGTLSLATPHNVGYVLATVREVPLKVNEWFPLEIRAEGKHLRVLVNGETVTDHEERNDLFTAGRLGLYCAGNTEVRFRKPEIKELP
jgi:hypothetical protein